MVSVWLVNFRLIRRSSNLICKKRGGKIGEGRRGWIGRASRLPW